jgi:hypothetical protein
VTQRSGFIDPGALSRSTHLPGYVARPPRPPSDAPPEITSVDGESQCNAKASRSQASTQNGKRIFAKRFETFPQVRTASGPLLIRHLELPVASTRFDDLNRGQDVGAKWPPDTLGDLKMCQIC